MKVILTNISKRRLRTCENSLQMLVYEVAYDSPYDFIITHGHRTAEEQQKLYATGRTLPGRKVTNCDGIIKKSKHNHCPSLAFDIAVKIDNKVTWDVKYYKIMGERFKKAANDLGIKINWPINIGSITKPVYDYAHIEI